MNMNMSMNMVSIVCAEVFYYSRTLNLKRILNNNNNHHEKYLKVHKHLNDLRKKDT